MNNKHIDEHVIVEKFGIYGVKDSYGFGYVLDEKVVDGRTMYYVQNTTGNADNEKVWLNEDEVTFMTEHLEGNE